MFKKIISFVLRNVIVLLLAGIIINQTVDLNMEGIFSDVYDYGSLEAKSEMISQINEPCPVLLGVENLDLIESEQNVTRMKELCLEYNRTLDDKQFFLSYLDFSSEEQPIKRSFSFDLLTEPDSWVNKLMIFLFFSFLITLCLVYIITLDFAGLIRESGKMLISLGSIFAIPFFLIYTYFVFFPLDTSVVLEAMVKGIDLIKVPWPILKVISLLVLNKIFTSYLFAFGLICIIVGIVIKRIVRG